MKENKVGYRNTEKLYFNSETQTSSTKEQIIELGELLPEFWDNYDHVIIECPPGDNFVREEELSDGSVFFLFYSPEMAPGVFCVDKAQWDRKRIQHLGTNECNCKFCQERTKDENHG